MSEQKVLDNSALPHLGNEPALVVLCSWTNASLELVKKYSNGYASLFPNTKVLVLTTHFGDLVCPGVSGLKQQTEIAAKLIHKGLSNHDRDSGAHTSGIPLHIFSEGGCFKACKLAEIYKETYNEKLRVSALVLDSTPGKPRYLRHCKGLAKAISNNYFLQAVSLPAAFAITGAVWLGYMICTDFANNPMSWSRRALLDGHYFHNDTAKPVLLYIYSMQDDIVDYRDIKKHTMQAKAEGFSVI